MSKNSTDWQDRPRLALIVAMGRERGIGLKGKMPWGHSLKRDLKHFKNTTMGCPVIMGRKTYESLPTGALPGRRNIVLSQSRHFSPRDAEVFSSLREAIASCQGVEKIFVIGGGELYRQAMDLADELHVTLVDGSFPEADTYFPEITPQWLLRQSDYHHPDEENPYGLFFQKYERI